MEMNYCFNEKHEKSRFCATSSKRSIWYDMPWPKQVDVSMATVFWQACFSQFWFPCIFNQNFAVSFVIFTFLDPFSVYLMFFIRFRSILTFFSGGWRHVTSSTHFMDVKGNSFRRTIYPRSLIAIALTVWKPEICHYPYCHYSMGLGVVWAGFD